MHFSKAIVVLSIALTGLASPHELRGIHHRDLARRAAMPAAAPEPVVVPPKKRSGRCKVRSTLSAAAATTSVSSSSPSSSAIHPTSTTQASPSSSIIPPQNVESTASSATPQTTEAPQPTTTKEQPTTTKGQPTTTKEQPTTTKEQPTTTKEQPTTTVQPTTTKKTTAAAAPITSSSSSSGSSASDPLGILTGTHSGDGTFYATGLGSCGITNTDTDFIAAVSHELYDQFPGYDGANPNNNPLCKRMLKATYQGKSVEVMAVDRCTGCALFDLDFSPSAFSQLADFSVGRLTGVEWDWIS